MILKKTNRIPPFVCRIMARKAVGYAPLSTTDIAKSAGISRFMVEKISAMPSWAEVPIGIAEKFSTACGVDLSRPWIHLRWLRRSKLAHLRFANPQQRKMFAKLLATRATSES